MSNTAQEFATKKLINIYKSASTGSDKQTAAIYALGRVGGIEAAKALASIYDSAGTGTKKQLACIEALGEVGRVVG